MGDGQVVVKTDVDRLIALIEQKKEISVPDAAKQLGVLSQTIESLGDLLEEEGIIHIKYKFTTPYFIYAKAAGKESLGPGTTEVVEESGAPQAPGRAALPDVAAIMDVKREFFSKTRERGIPDDKAAQLFDKYLGNNSDYIKGKFLETSRKLGVPEDKMEDLWQDYLAILKGA